MKPLLFMIVSLFALQLHAQNFPVSNISISLANNPDAKTENWKSGASMLTITANAKMVNGRVIEQAESCKIMVYIRKAGTRVCGAYQPNTSPATGFSSAAKVWAGNNAVSLLGQQCTLTPGDYEICVQFYNAQGTAPISAEKCRPFTIVANTQLFQAPQNMVPFDGAIFNTSMATQPVLFRWSLVTPNPGETVTYRLKVWKLLQGQTPIQAINLNQPAVIKDVNNFNQTHITNLMDPSCLPPGSCDFVWQVQALGATGVTIGANAGKSQPTVFGTEKNSSLPVTGGPGACSTVSVKTYAAGDEILLSDDFKLTLTAAPTGTNDSLSGKGIVRVKWLGIFNVKFNGIKVNSQDRLCAGAVYTNTDPGLVYPTQFLLNAANVNVVGGWTIDGVRSVAQWIKAKAGIKPLVAAAAQVDSLLTPLPIDMPVGYFKGGDTSTAIGFTEMVFRPDYAEFEVIASLNTEKIFKSVNSLYGTDAISLHGAGIRFTQTGLSGVNGSIKLLEPLVVSYNNTGTENLKLTFNKEAGGHIGNGVVFSTSNNEFWKYNLDVDVDLPREWLIPADTTRTNVSLNFQTAITHWNDFVLEGSLPACVIPNSNGLALEAGVIAYDHSYITNPSQIVFPEGYTGNTNSFFSGFYMKHFKLVLPDQLRSYADTGKKIQVVAQNLIIDEYGLSGKVLANNVLNYPKANIGNLGASIDTVSIRFAANSLTEARMRGKITLPLSSADNVSNALHYTALFNGVSQAPGGPQASSLVFTLKPGSDITSKFLGDGKVEIKQTSAMSLTLTKNGQQREVAFYIDLNGKVYYPTGKIIDPGSSIPMDLDLSCNFQHLGMYYKKAANDSFSLNTGQWSFASPQKKLSGFAFTITDVTPKIDPIGSGTEKQYLFKGGVEFVAKINIGSENSNVAISGDTRIALTGAIESAMYTPPTGGGASGQPANMNVLTSQVQTPNNLDWKNPGGTINALKTDYGFLTQLKPKYLGVEVKSIHIDATMAAVKIKGSVDFYKKDPKYGNGFRGDLEAKFTTAGLALQAGAVFGNTKYIPGNTGNGFKYWMVQAQVNIPPPGIVFMTGVAFRGFGAGVYSRMNMTPPAVFNPTAAAASTFGGAVFTPDAGVKMGFKAKAIIATTPKEETFNGSVALGAEFNTSGGMNFIQFDGLFNCGAQIGQENQAFANGAVNVKYDFPNKIFSMNSLLSINKDPITTPQPISTRLYINSKQNKWYFKSGTPDTPMTVRISGVDIQSYLMFGNDLGNDIPKGFMRETRNGFAGIGYSLPPFSETATGDNKYQSAKGFAFGLGVNYKTASSWSVVDYHGSLCDCRRYLDINYSINAGGEIDASLLQYANCAGFGKGWRAKMSIAVYAGAILNYSYNLPLFNSASGELGRVASAAYATAEFPNPTYIEGQLMGNFSIAGYGVGFSKHFVSGSQCAGSEISPDPSVTSYTQQNVADSQNYTLIKNIVSPATANVSRTTDFLVLLNYPFNEAFEVEEQQATGEIKVRTFRANYTVTLKQDSMATTGPGTGPVKTIGTAAKLTAGNNPPVNTTGNTVQVVDAGTNMIGARRFTLTKTQFVINPLKANTSYRFQVVGRLEEKIGTSWLVVKKKGSNAPIQQTAHLWFKTNSDATGGAVTTPNVPASTIKKVQ